MNLEQQTYHRWEKERDSLREQIAAMEDKSVAIRFDDQDTRRDTTEDSLTATRAALADTERLLEKYDYWRA